MCEVVSGFGTIWGVCGPRIFQISDLAEKKWFRLHETLLLQIKMSDGDPWPTECFQNLTFYEVFFILFGVYGDLALPSGGGGWRPRCPQDLGRFGGTLKIQGGAKNDPKNLIWRLLAVPKRSKGAKK